MSGIDDMFNLEMFRQSIIDPKITERNKDLRGESPSIAGVVEYVSDKTSEIQVKIDNKQDNLLKISGSAGQVLARNSNNNALEFRDEESLQCHNAYNYLNQIDDYLFEVQYSTKNVDYDYANKYYSSIQDSSDLSNGGCTGIFKDGRVLRQLDWCYDSNAEFIVRRTKDIENDVYSSIGMSAGAKTLTKEFVESGAYNEKFKLIPFTTTDGINETGLFVQSNVVPLDDNKSNYNLNPTSTKKCCIAMALRYILDYCGSFTDVHNFFNTYNIYSTKAVNYGYHFLLVQNGDWEIIELTNDGYIIVNSSNSSVPHGIITNFRMTDLSFTGDNVDVESIEDYGQGVERFNLATAAFTDSIPLETLRYELFYKKSYSPLTQPQWLTEFTGEDDPTESGRKLTVMDSINSPSKFDSILSSERAKYSSRTRQDGKDTWQTTHSAIYNLSRKGFNIAIQERLNTTYDFYLDESLVAGNNITIENNVISADITTYKPFPDDFVTIGTLQEVVESMLSSSGAKQGMAYLGEIEGECTPFGYGNIECKVEFMLDDICVLSVNSSNIIPYTWTYNSFSDDYTWKKYSDVIPNPSDSTSNVLSKVSIDGTSYNVGCLSQSLTATNSVGGVSAGDTFPAGTSLESILRKILINN